MFRTVRTILCSNLALFTLGILVGLLVVIVVSNSAEIEAQIWLTRLKWDLYHPGTGFDAHQDFLETIEELRKRNREDEAVEILANALDHPHPVINGLARDGLGILEEHALRACDRLARGLTSPSTNKSTVVNIAFIRDSILERFPLELDDDVDQPSSVSWTAPVSFVSTESDWSFKSQ